MTTRERRYRTVLRWLTVGMVASGLIGLVILLVQPNSTVTSMLMLWLFLLVASTVLFTYLADRERNNGP